MRSIVLIASTWLLGAASAQAAATLVKDAEAKKKLLGKHPLTLQWVDEPAGSADVTEKDGVLSLNGEQRSKKKPIFVTIAGKITSVDKTEFVFEGKVVVQVVSGLKGEHTKPCTREGKLTFAIKGERKYWRMQQMQSPCTGKTDYVDIHLR